MENMLLAVGIVAAVALCFAAWRYSRIESPAGTSVEEIERRTLGPTDRSKRDAVRDELLAGYTLQSRETGFFGEWRETVIDGQRVAFQLSPHQLGIHVGNFDADDEQLSDVYLNAVAEGHKASSKRCLEQAMGPEGLDAPGELR